MLAIQSLPFSPLPYLMLEWRTIIGARHIIINANKFYHLSPFKDYSRALSDKKYSLNLVKIILYNTIEIQEKLC